MSFKLYQCPPCSFPPKHEWKSFEEIFNANKPEMLKTGSNDSVGLQPAPFGANGAYRSGISEPGELEKWQQCHAKSISSSE